MTASRRLQLAAEGSGVIGLALRRWRRRAEASEFKYPTASVTRWRVSALPSARYPFRASDAPDGGSNWSGVEPGSPRLSSWRRATLRVDSLCLRSCTIDRYQWHGHACRARHCRSLSPRTPANCLALQFGARGSSLSTRSTGRPAHLHGLLPPILSAHIDEACDREPPSTRKEASRWTTAVNVKRLLPPRQSRGTSLGG